MNGDEMLRDCDGTLLKKKRWNNSQLILAAFRQLATGFIEGRKVEGGVGRSGF